MTANRRYLTGIIAGLILTPCVANAVGATQFTYNGVDYTIEVRSGAFQDLAALNADVPWWGDSTLALDLAQVIDPLVTETSGFAPTAYTMPFLVYGNGGFCSYWAGGSTYACQGYNTSSSTVANYIWGTASIPSPYTLLNAQVSILSTNLGLESNLSSASTLVNGAHSRPMSRRVNEGEKQVWTAGDWGNDNHGSRSGSVGLAELGAGYNFGPVQVNLSLGKTWAKQDLILGGDIDSDGKYVMVEGIFPISGDTGLYATIGAYRHWGDTEIRRGYLNDATQEFSYASPDADTYGFRARIDWENAFSLNTVRFSPYADLWHSKSKLDRYTETGGEFPAQFNSRENNITELRAGLNTAMPIKTSGFDFVANLEAVHRFDDKADNTSGQVVGLFAFNLEGQKYDQNWFKGGIGVEGKLGQGKASLMLNGTTEGEMASSWLAASYQMAF